jgi:glutathione S-transferase
MSLVLYDAMPSANSERVWMTLFEKGLSYERVTLNLRKREQKEPKFLELNPYGRVPVLVDDGNVLFESCVINDYLDAKYPSPALWPADPYLRARGQVLVDYALNFLQDTYWPLRVEMFKSAHERDASVVDSKRRILKEMAGFLENDLAGKPFLVGDFSLADINVWPRLSRLEEYGVLPDSSLPRLSAWLQRMKQRPSVQSIQGRGGSKV